MKAGRPSFTARYVALTRATIDRPSSPTGDPAAEARLYRSLGPAWLGRHRPPHSRQELERRTRFIDSAIVGALQRGVRQIVILAAGYDGRSLRFATPTVRFFEVDHPSTQADKLRRLRAVGASTEGITFLAVDLMADDLVSALEDAGFESHSQAVFLVEGLLGYLPRDKTRRLLADLHRLAAPDSDLVATFPLDPTPQNTLRQLRRGARVALLRAIGEPWLHRFTPTEVVCLLEDEGWTAVQPGKNDVGVVVLTQPAG